MRPPAKRQSALRAPLNDMLGTDVSVRILRVLTETSTPLGRAEIARRAELNASGVRRAVTKLVDLGIAETVGVGPRRPVRLRREHPLTRALMAVFAAEATRFEELLEGLRSAVANLRPPPQSAWVEGPVARAVDVPGAPVVVGLLAPAAEADAASERLRGLVVDVMRRHDVRVDVRPYAAADLVVMSADELAGLEDVIPLSGPPPLAVMGVGPARSSVESGPKNHADLDRRALAFGRAIAERLSEDSSLVDRARASIHRRLKEASSGEQKALREWDRLLRSLSVSQLRNVLVDPGESSTRLRQTLPFLEVLSQEERAEILEEVTE